jgi:hypothetical protein
VLIIKRANRVFPVIEPILQKYNVSDDFKYLAVIESGLTNAVSGAVAKGVWQFMPDAAKEKGMEVNDIVDERYHLEMLPKLLVNICCLPKKNLVHGHWLLHLTKEG